MIRKLLARAAGGLKAAMRWTGQQRYWWQFLLPRTRFDYAREIGDGTTNSIVAAVLQWMARTFPEAPVGVQEQRDDGEWAWIPRHPLGLKIERPNPFFSGPLLWMATLIDWMATGDAYWIKVRDRADENVVELWWAPSWTMEPKWPRDGMTFISHYEYRADPGKPPVVYKPSEVVHFRYGIDPQNTRKGLSPLRAVLKEVFTDEEGASMTAALIRNLGIPGVLIAPEDRASKVSDEAAEEIKDAWQQKFGGDRRGEPLVMKAPTKVQVMSFSPEQMTLKDLRRIPEERVTAVLGVSAVVVGLGAGLDRSTMTNFPAMREAAWESNMVPAQRLIAADLTVQLLPDFEKADGLDRRRVAFDLRDVRVLQEDMDKLVERYDRGVRGGWIKVSEAKRAVALPVGPDDDVYLRPFTVVPVRDGSEVPPAPKGAALKALAAAAFVEQLAETRARIVAQHERELRRFFRSQAGRVLERLGAIVALRGANGSGRGGAKAPVVGPLTLLPEQEDALLAEALRPIWLAGLSGGWELAAEAFALESGFDAESAVVAAALSEAVHRAGRINDGTRTAIGQALDEGQRRGYSLQQIVAGVPADDFPGLRQLAESYYAGRPQAVVQTEAMWSTNMGTAAAYRANGIARVQMIDGGDDPACAARNGAIVSVSAGEAATNHEHPRGTLTLVPVA